MKAKKTKFSRVEVRFHEGYKGKEIPRSVRFGEREVRIDRVLNRSRICNGKTGEISDVYTCEMDGKKIRITVQEDGRVEFATLTS
jgi:hypothetical protein